MLESERKSEWCWFCDRYCTFVYNEEKGKWFCGRCRTEQLSTGMNFLKVGTENTMGGLKDYEERRKYSRRLMDLPVEYQIGDVHKPYGGIAMNGNEAGLRILAVKGIPVGAVLNVNVLFPTRFRLTHFEASAVIVWKGIHSEEDWHGYRYGLKFIQISRGEFQKLNPLLATKLSEESFEKLMSYSIRTFDHQAKRER